MARILESGRRNNEFTPGHYTTLWDLGLPNTLSSACSRVARKTGFFKRCRKINPAQFLQALVIASSEAAFSLRLIALFFGLLSNQRLSKQAVAKRINASCVDFLRGTVFSCAADVSKFEALRQNNIFGPFCRVLIQDSTVVSLPQKFASHFPGAVNQTRKEQAALKIQTVYNLLGEDFPYFDLSGFTRTDQAASGDILTIARPGDLILRDLGYFSTRVFGRMLDQGIHFLSRLRYRVGILHTETRKPIDLLAILKREGRFDQNVLMGAKDQVPVRLVALPVPEQVANERRRKARNNRDRRCNPNKHHLEMLGWNIFVTSVPESTWDSNTVEKVYRVRWRIEIIFKAWKSHFNMTEIPTGSVYELETLIWAKLLSICLFQSLFAKLDQYFYYRGTQASLLKVAQFYKYLLGSLLGTICPVQVSIEIIKQHLLVEKSKQHKRLTPIILLS